MKIKAFPFRAALMGVSVLALGACGGAGGFDFDLRGGAGVLDTSDAVRNATSARPQPDARGVISYPGYQVAIAQRGDTIESVAARIGTDAVTLASYNAIPQNTTLRDGEIIALPSRVSEPGSGALVGGNVDVATIAGAAIDRADGAPGLPAGAQPTRHRVAPGETAFSIARLYDVPVAALAEWNGLGPDLALREGQYLLIPTPAPDAGVQVASLDPIEAPGSGSVTPVPPSASQPLPQEDTRTAAAAAPAAEPLRESQTAASDTARLRMPVQGRIIRTYQKGQNDGIGISASAGTAVTAADDGTVAAITRDTDQVPILVVRHEGNLLTVYAGVDQIAVKKGDTVKRGQKIAVVRAATPPFLHFEVREGFESVDPGPYLN
ncbi:MAG: peptidoglycan DD-metalloendopeptidase family protein [Silicimonas sp.]